MNKYNVGIIGCGNIGPAYVKGCAQFDVVEVVVCADIDHGRAKQFAKEHDLKAMTVEKMLADPDIQIVINLTIPEAHAEVSLAALMAGKHVHSEKPLATNREDGRKILDLAAKKGLLVGCAPDTILGGGQQTCRKLIDDGWIGRPVAATAFMLGHGMEMWHPNPYFFFQPGAGPMFDMGPYYLTALVNLLGSVERITSVTSISLSERIVTSQPNYGQRIPVNTPTHVTGLMNFASGAVGTIITSFDVWAHSLPRIEIYGTEGSLSVPDPNTFCGPVKLYRPADKEWREIPLSHSDEIGRGIGVADMAMAIESGRPLRASGQLAFHVLDLMQSFLESSETGQHIELESQCEQPLALPLNLPPRQLDG